MISLKTNRLIISDHEYSDLDAMHKLLSHETAMYYLQDIKTETLEESMENLTIAINEANSENRKKYFFKMVYSDTGEYVGEIGFTVTQDTPMGKIVNLGYFILPEFWGQGFVTEAAKAVISFAFEEADVVKVQTGCIKDNKGSEKIMQKLGMIKEADYKMHVWHDNKFKDRVEFRILKEEWDK